MKKMLHSAVRYGSGEFVLDHMPNGGTAVLVRSLLVTAIAVIFVAPLKAYLAKDTIFLSFSIEQAKGDLGDILPWVGAIFAGVYAAFYSRFAAQWSYLAGLYNQLMATCASIPEAHQSSSRALSTWHAAFIEDAVELHLAAKPMFASMVVALLQDGEIVRDFVESTIEGPRKLAELERKLRFTAVPPAVPKPLGNSCPATAAAAPTKAPA
ncbi:hypothetical protein [Lysobacter sp. HA35]